MTVGFGLLVDYQYNQSGFTYQDAERAVKKGGQLWIERPAAFWTPCTKPNSPVCHQSQHKQLPIPSSPHKDVGKRKHLSGTPMVLVVCLQLLSESPHSSGAPQSHSPPNSPDTNKQDRLPASTSSLGGRNEQEQCRQTLQDSLFSSRIPREAGRSTSAAALLCHKQRAIRFRQSQESLECTGCEAELKKLMQAWSWCTLNIGNNFPESSPTCDTHPSLPVGDSME